MENPHAYELEQTERMLAIWKRRAEVAEAKLVRYEAVVKAAQKLELVSMGWKEITGEAIYRVKSDLESFGELAAAVAALKDTDDG